MSANGEIGTIGGAADMEKDFWNMQLDYLKSTRAQMWNQDYLSFIHARSHLITYGTK